MNLVERFLAISTWPAARITMVLAGIGAAFSAFAALLGPLVIQPLGWIDMAWWYGMLTGVFVPSLLGLLISWWADKRGLEGRWTYFIFGPTIGVGLLMALYAMGFASTPAMAFIPLAVLPVIVWYDAAIGRFVIGLCLAVMAVTTISVATGWLPSAPAIDGRDLDVQADPAWVIGVGVFLIAALFIIFAVIGVIVWSARRTNFELAVAHGKLEAASRLIARYVPVEVAEDILEGRLGDNDTYERRKLTIFFSDLVGFTDIAEDLEPEDLAVVLNEYFGEMTAIAQRHRGTVDELQGDALLILFGAPRATSDSEHALNAVRMANEMHAAMDRLNQQWAARGITVRLRVRMGIDTGVVTVGNFGTAERMKYAALGRHVNIAARLQALAEPGSTVISYATYLLVRDGVATTALGAKQLKGVAKPVEAYAVG